MGVECTLGRGRLGASYPTQCWQAGSLLACMACLVAATSVLFIPDGLGGMPLVPPRLGHRHRHACVAAPRWLVGDDDGSVVKRSRSSCMSAQDPAKGCLLPWQSVTASFQSRTWQAQTRTSCASMPYNAPENSSFSYMLLLQNSPLLLSVLPGPRQCAWFK